MILETHCYACNRTMPVVLWSLHLWWYSCPGKTVAEHDQEHGLVHGVPREDYAKLEEWRRNNKAAIQAWLRDPARNQVPPGMPLPYRRGNQ